ncbi:hypothetical protein DSOUD_1772 [Desulfuromonas soudanensis]|uniref:Uncharacterized protein n=1 Tax=Desulfuromonas soudanensis TaxID=1603606 RepID=A0A0M4DHJ8_9BACT|nr:hypothetical protein [Desulfuromonas soudanensis]ALC16550.1 hypothetical protein DSOUD_1772 [Desulfuromonas soudanensis]
MKKKEITVIFYGRRYPRQDWTFHWDQEAVDELLVETAREFLPLGIVIEAVREEGIVLDINGYGDLLNTVRIRSSGDGIANLCLGHILGSSPNRNLIEDIRRGVSRVAFAPETIEPEGSDKIVCHNCGCGC